MATTQLDVCIYALALVGGEDLTQAQLDDKSSKAGRLCSIFYPVILQDLLRSHKWNFSRVTAELSSIAGDVSEGGWGYDFTLPTDYLQAIELHSTDNGGKIDDAQWEIIDGVLYCDDSEVSLKYVAYKEQPDDWSTDFRRLMCYSLAVELSFPLGGSNKLVERLFAQHKSMIADVRYNNAKENSRQNLKVNTVTGSRK